MKPEAALHRPGEIAFRHREDFTGQLRLVLISRQGTEIAAVRRSQRVGRQLRGQLLERLAGTNALENCRRLGFGRRFVVTGQDQDVPRAALLILQIATLVVVIVALQRALADFDRIGNLAAPELDVLDGGRFGQHVERRIVVVIRLDHRVVSFDLCADVFLLDGRHGNDALLGEQVEVATILGRRDESGRRDREL